MELIRCCHCGDLFPPSPRHKSQDYCMKAGCRKARKAAWKRHKMRTDPDYKFHQRMSNKKWAEANPGYWKEYRKKKPKKAEKNRILQTIRNRRRPKNQDLNTKVDASSIAKVDASKSNNFKLVGQFWLVPVIAKVDALKVYIHEISTSYH